MPCGRERRHAEHHVAHVADRRVGDELLQVRLRHGAERAVDDVAGAERGEQPERQAVPARSRQRRRRQDAVVDAQDAVGAHLEQHAGQDDRDRRRRLDVRVGQPGVEREGRDLDGEADEEREPEQQLDVERDRVGHQARPASCMSKRVRVGREVEDEHRDQHQHRAEQRVEEELDRRVLAPRAAPDADQEVHRQQHDLPEDVEEEEVERDERRPSCRSRAAGRARSSPSRAFSIPNDASMQRNESSAVSSTIVMLMPSTPTKYSML